jgi:hypothetical protein
MKTGLTLHPHPANKRPVVSRDLSCAYVRVAWEDATFKVVDIAGPSSQHDDDDGEVWHSWMVLFTWATSLPLSLPLRESLFTAHVSCYGGVPCHQELVVFVEAYTKSLHELRRV